MLLLLQSDKRGSGYFKHFSTSLPLQIVSEEIRLHEERPVFLLTTLCRLGPLSFIYTTEGVLEFQETWYFGSVYNIYTWIPLSRYRDIRCRRFLQFGS